MSAYIFTPPNLPNKFIIQHGVRTQKAIILATPAAEARKCYIHSFIHSIGMCKISTIPCRSQELLPFLSLCTFSCHPSPPTILPSSPTPSCHLFLGLLSILLFPNSYIILFWEFYFLPFSVHVQTIVIYLTLLLLL